MIRVGVFGAGGRMGATVCRAVLGDPDLELVAAVDPHHAGLDLRQVGVDGAEHADRARAPTRWPTPSAEVAVDFTVVDAARENLAWCADHGVHAVVGTTGFSGADLDGFRERFAASDANCVIAPNFAIGAVLMMRFAELAAPYFETRRDHRAAPRRARSTRRRAPPCSPPSGWPAASDEWARRPDHHDGGRRRPGRRGRRRHPRPLGAPARPGRPPGGAARHHRADPHASATTPTTARRSCPACCWR